MSDPEAFSFRIRPLPPKGAAASAEPRSAAPPPAPPTVSAPTAPPPAPSPPDAPPGPLDQGAARFHSAQAALSFLGAVAGAGLAEQASARRGPQGRWWVVVPAPWSQVAALAANAGGQAYAGRDRHWSACPADGSAPPPPPLPGSGAADALHLQGHLQGPTGAERLPLADWPAAGLADLLLGARLRPARPRQLRGAVVVAPGTLARVVVRRALGLGLAVQAAPAEREPLAGGPLAAVTWLHLTWDGPRAPEAFLHSVLRLPGVAAVRPAGLAEGEDPAQARLLVDLRHAAPLSSTLVATLVPAGERWLLGAPDLGHWRVRVLGPTTDAAELIEPPRPATAPTADPDCAPDPAQGLPVAPAADYRAPIALRLVARPATPGHPDAVLLDDAELGWLRDYLIGRPAADTAYLAFGPGRHLLLAPGGLLSTLPFGLGLRRIGPGGLHLQEGWALYPPLPESARALAFPCGPGELVALTQGGAQSSPGSPPGSAPADGLAATRFRLDPLTPVWALWLGEPPPVAAGAESGLARSVRALAAEISPRAQAAWRRQIERVIPALRQAEPPDRDRLLRQALALQDQGRLAEAARCLEQAGELVAAGRLYERAAG